MNAGLKFLVCSIYIPAIVLKLALSDLAKVKNPLNRYKEYKKKRGMSMYYDWIDWLGGLPFEVARPDEIVEFYKLNSLRLTNSKITNTAGINEFVFTKKKN